MFVFVNCQALNTTVTVIGSQFMFKEVSCTGLILPLSSKDYNNNKNSDKHEQ